MALAKQRDNRANVVALAGLIWSDHTSAELQEFIRCGSLGAASSQAMPYSPAVLEAYAGSNKPVRC